MLALGSSCFQCCKGAPGALCSDLWAKEILALLKLFQNVLAVSAMTVACEAETRRVIKISSYACLLEKQAIKTVLKGRLKYIININRYVQGWKERREGSGESLQ